jgi:hypothetical protein
MLAQPIGDRIGIAHPHRRKGLGKMGDHRRIEPIGLGQPPRGAGKLAHLARVDHRRHQPRLGERQPQRPLVPAGRFQHDPRRAQRPQPRDQRAIPGRVIADRKTDAQGTHMHVQASLRYVNPDKHTVRRHHPIPFLQLRARAPATVRA